MRKRYYSDYVRHMIRSFNAQNRRGETPTDLNYLACKAVFDRHTDRVQDILCGFCTGISSDSDDSVVFELSNSTGVAVAEVWRTIRTVEREIANERGLLNDTK